MRRIRPVITIALAALAVLAAGSLRAQSTPPTKELPVKKSPAEKPSAESLLDQQQRLAKTFAQLEAEIIALADYIASTNPQRAAMLRRAVKLSKDENVSGSFADALQRLQGGRVKDFDAAIKNQQKIQDDLRALLELLSSENRAKRLASQKARTRAYIKQINRLIKQQQGLQGRARGDDDLKQLAKQQKELAKKTRELAKEIKRNEEGGDTKEAKPKDAKPKDTAKPASGNPKDSDAKKGDPKKGDAKKGDPKQVAKDQQQQSKDDEQSNPVRRRIDDAEKRMREAQKKLEEAKRDGAVEDQEEALRKLNKALAELEKILRQLREEEIERTLVLLEARFQRMLKMQDDVLRGTRRLDKVPEKERQRDEEIEAGRLGRAEQRIVQEADRALALLADDGTVVAFPVALRQVREDMVEVAGRLARVQVGPITQGVEEDVVAALEEMIAALKIAIKDQGEKRRSGRSGRVSQAVAGDPPLVGILGELKMIRSLQVRVRRRTGRYQKIIAEHGQAQKPELVEALRRLAGRELDIHRIVRDIDLGKNK
ncbi:MAG: hypothetical protein IID44_11160 [Planctomycetes bacterium]|nr:hypothetical protein [Planctomycetota bacterium]